MLNVMIDKKEMPAKTNLFIQGYLLLISATLVLPVKGIMDLMSSESYGISYIIFIISIVAIFYT